MNACGKHNLLIILGDSSRVVGLVQLLLQSGAASSLIEDYAACLELRSEECQMIENSCDDPGVLIMQVNTISLYECTPTQFCSLSFLRFRCISSQYFSLVYFLCNWTMPIYLNNFFY